MLDIILAVCLFASLVVDHMVVSEAIYIWQSDVDYILLFLNTERSCFLWSLRSLLATYEAFAWFLCQEAVEVATCAFKKSSEMFCATSPLIIILLPIMWSS